MGKSNPVKKIAKNVESFARNTVKGKNPLKEASRFAKRTTDDVAGGAIKMTGKAFGSLGLKGVEKGLLKAEKGVSELTSFTEKGLGLLSDVATGKADRMKADAKSMEAERARAIEFADAERRRVAEGERIAGIEKERMGAGSLARTILTGNDGVEEEENFTRRRLLGI